MWAQFNTLILMALNSTGNQRILLVGMADSIHLARWILQFEGLGFEFQLISSSPHRAVHPEIRDMIAKTHPAQINIKMSFLSRYLSLPLWLFDRILGDSLRGSLIRYTIGKFKPSIVHALELQNAGYSTSVAFDGLRNSKKPKLLITNYGSEIVWFRQFPKHLIKLRRLMAHADAFSAECDRDVRLAKEIGFTGQFLRTIPVSGGVDPASQMSEAREIPPSNRNTIAIKGYQNVWGQALVAIEALSKIAPLISKFDIEMFSCNRKTISAARKVAKKTGLKITAHGKKSLTHSQVLDILRRSRVYVGLSKSDGISTSMIEAMSQGAIPIQSNTSCGNEWIRDGLDGFLVPYYDSDLIASRLLFILNNTEFAQVAQETNFATITSKYDKAKLSKIASGYYTQLSSQSKLSK